MYISSPISCIVYLYILLFSNTVNYNIIDDDDDDGNKLYNKSLSIFFVGYNSIFFFNFIACQWIKKKKKENEWNANKIILNTDSNVHR